MAAAQTKGHEEDKHTGMQEKNKQQKNEKRKLGSKAQKQARKSVLPFFFRQILASLQ